MSTTSSPTLSAVESLAVGALSAEAQRIQQMSKQFESKVAAAVSEIETSHPGYTLNKQTLQLVPVPVAVPVIAEAKPEIDPESPKQPVLIK